MKLHTTKEWFDSRVDGEIGKNIEVRPAKETPSSDSERRLVVPLCPRCQGEITHGLNGYCSFFCAVESQMKKTHTTMTNHLIDHRGNMIVQVGDEVENDDARFFVGAINESQQLCVLDKSKTWTLKNEASPMAACIRQGNYSASATTLSICPKP